MASSTVRRVCEVEVQPLPATGQDVGLDLGLIDFLVTDTGQAVPNPRPLRKAQERLAAAQCSLQRRKRGSHRRAKQRLRFARQCQRVANTRKDFHHKTARVLVRANDTLSLPRDQVSAMVIKRLGRSRQADAA